MIKLKVEERCHNCPGFEPETNNPVMAYSIDGDEIGPFGDTVIMCVHRIRCRHIERYLEKHLKNEIKIYPEEWTDKKED